MEYESNNYYVFKGDYSFGFSLVILTTCRLDRDFFLEMFLVIKDDFTDSGELHAVRYNDSTIIDDPTSDQINDLAMGAFSVVECKLKKYCREKREQSQEPAYLITGFEGSFKLENLELINRLHRFNLIPNMLKQINDLTWNMKLKEDLRIVFQATKIHSEELA